MTLYDHAITVYRAMHEQANQGTDDKLRFEGSKVELFRSTGISQGYYSKVFDGLTELGCIVQERRGTAYYPSVIVLIREPGDAEWAALHKSRLTRPSAIATIEQQVRDLARRVPSIDVDATVVDIYRRLDEIESRLDALEQGR